jgi:hypothetical protein
LLLVDGQDAALPGLRALGRGQSVVALGHSGASGVLDRGRELWVFRGGRWGRRR